MRRFKSAMLLMAVMAVTALMLLGLMQQSIASYQSGTNNGFFWSVWTDDQSGTVNYANGSGGNYSVSWNYTGNFTCGKGWSTGSLTRIVGYNCGSYNHSGGGGVFGYYGWTRNPLREYYVNEMWGTGRPTGTYMSTISSDGGNYDTYRSQRINAPSIDGTQTFWQIYSTRTAENSTGQNHSITFANHANAWANAGWGLGTDLSPAAILLTEAYSGSSGNVNATVWLAGESGGGGGGGGTIRRYESYNYATNFIRHQGYRGRVDPNVNPIQDSQFNERAGLNGVSGTVSLESVNFPGRFLRHRTNGEVWLDQNDNTTAFRNSATWFKRAGLSNGGASSFEAQSNPGTYMRHRSFLLYRESVSGAANADATFWTR